MERNTGFNNEKITYSCLKMGIDYSTPIKIFALYDIFKSNYDIIKDQSKIPKTHYEKYYTYVIGNVLLQKKDDISINDFYKYLILDNIFREVNINKINKIYNDKLEYYTNFYRFSNIKFTSIIDNDYPSNLKEVFISEIDNDIKKKQYIPLIFFYYGNIDLLKSNDKKCAIVGTRHIKDYEVTKHEVMRVNNKHKNAICVSGLASGIDSLGSNIFDKSIVYVTETIPKIISKRERDDFRYEAKKKILETGLILSHVLPHQELNMIESRNALLNRNLFIVLTADIVLPIEYGMKSGTISAINHAIKNNKEIFTPRSLVEDDVVRRFKEDITYYT